jgi:Glycosyl hydrolase family 47
LSLLVQGLIPTTINRQSGSGGATFSVGAAADSYYEYLLKLWLLGGQKVHTLALSHKPCGLWLTNATGKQLFERYLDNVH